MKKLGSKTFQKNPKGYAVLTQHLGPVLIEETRILTAFQLPPITYPVMAELRELASKNEDRSH